MMLASHPCKKPKLEELEEEGTASPRSAVDASSFQLQQQQQKQQQQQQQRPQPPIDIQLISAPGISYPETSFTQQQVGELLNIQDKTTWKLLKSPHIQKRHLYLPKTLHENSQPTASDRDATFQMGLEDMGIRALRECLTNAGQGTGMESLKEIDVLTTVTSTAMPMPGVSGRLIRMFSDHFRPDVQRSDIVGMGCNGGMSGLRSLATSLGQLAWMRQRTCMGLLFCIEVNSAFFLNRDNTGNGIVNALFGDGAAALLVSASPTHTPMPTPTLPLPPTPLSLHNTTTNTTGSPRTRITLIDFESYTIPEYFEDMKYEVDSDTQLLHFLLSKRIPQAVGTSVQIPVRTLLARHGCSNPSKDVRHWAVHGGGRRVTELVAESLKLDCQRDMRHTHSVMRDHGNLSSCSFLFSYARLLEEQLDHAAAQEKDEVLLQANDRIVFVAMGPGATIEVAMGLVC